MTSSLLTHDEADLVAAVREYTRRDVVPFVQQRDAAAEFPAHEVQQAALVGLTGLCIPEQYGGMPVSAAMLALVYEEVSAASAALGTILSVHNSLVCRAFTGNATSAMQERLLPRMATGACIGSYCLTEPHAGSDAASLRTRARCTDDGYVINGEKVFITSAPQAGVYIVFAVTDEQARTSSRISAFVVERDRPGITVGAPEHKLGIHASHTASVAFSDVEVPHEALLGREGGGFSIAMALLDGGRIGIAAQAVGIAQAALMLALTWARERQQFGGPISQHQAIQQRLADMSTEISAARQLVRHAAQLADAGQDHTRAASEAKLFASQVANRSTTSALQVFGGYGYLREYDVERLFRDARVTEIYEGTSEIQRLVIARRLLQEHAAPQNGA